jgi:formimidoylglutamate deiminase
MTSIFFRDALLPDGWARDVRVTIADGRLGSVVSRDALLPGDMRFDIGIPGLPNLHSHAFQRGMAGLSERRGPTADDFWTWREVMYRFLSRMTPEDVEAVAAQAYVEMLESGFTRVGEFHYLHHQPDGTPYDDPAEMASRIAAAAAAVGIGLTLLPCFYAHGGFGGVAPHTPGQRRFISDLDGFAKMLEASRRTVGSVAGAVVGIAPHSLRAVSAQELHTVVSLAPAGPIHIHAAEQTREVDDCLTWSGLRPVEWLLKHADLDTRWCLIHATHMTAGETLSLAATGAIVGLCPLTEANLGDGMFDGVGWTRAGGRFGIGTDSNIAIDAAAELRQLEYSQRLRHHARNVLPAGEGTSTGRALFDAALAGGAHALSAGRSGIEVGASADLVALDPGHPSLLGANCDQWLDGWVFATARPVVSAVWVRGQQVVADGCHRGRAEVAAAYRRALAKLTG